MAKTFTKRQLALAPGEFLSYFIRTHWEGASQTFKSGSPLRWSSGYLVACADPVAVASVVGFAQRDGQNGSSAGDKTSEFARAFPGMLLFANFLTTGGATTTLAATDFGTQTDLADDAVGHDGGVIWYAADETAAPTVEMISNISDEAVPNTGANPNRAAVGDSDVRVLFALLDSAISSVS